MFWSGETLKDRLPHLIDPFDEDHIDCASYRLTIGNEFYVSPSSKLEDPTTATTRRLQPCEWFAIPPGQFAYLLSKEFITVPQDAMAFISIRAKTKFHGLVSVSGFHADPGFSGQLTFAVFNAGPVQIHLKQGQDIFLMWFASLDREETRYKKDGKIQCGIDPDAVLAISGPLQSFASLTDKIKEVEKIFDKQTRSVQDALTTQIRAMEIRVETRMSRIEVLLTRYIMGVVSLAGLLTLLIGTQIKDWKPFQSPPATQERAAQPGQQK